MSKKILLMKKGMMGDVIMMTPAIRRIHNLYPEHEIFVWSDPRLHVLFENNPYIKGINISQPYDIVIDYDGKYNSTKHSNQLKFYMTYANQFIDMKIDEINNEDYHFDLFTSETDFDVSSYGNYVLFSPICRSENWKGRELLDVRPYDHLRKHLNKEGFNTVEIVCCNKVYGKCNYTSGPYELNEFIDIVRKASMVVTIDTGTLHICQALKIPTISIFGKVTPRSRLVPGMECIKVVQKDVPCIGCFAKRYDPMYCEFEEDCMILEKETLTQCYEDSGIKNLISFP